MASSFHNQEMDIDSDVAEAMEIDAYNASLPSPSPSASPLDLNTNLTTAEEAAFDDQIASLTSDLHTLTLRAQHQLYQQPRSTQQKLSAQTRDLYKKYSQHGSMLRLSEQLRKFLTALEPLSTELGYMTIWSDDEIQVLNDMYPDTVIPSNTEKSFEELCENSDANTTTTPTGRRVAYNNDPDSTMLVHETPFNPADMRINFPSGLDIPDPFMKCINNILLLENSSAQARLRHRVGKYCLPGPGMGMGHPHALPLLRLGVSSATSASLSNMFETAATNDFGLTSESRKLLRQAYDAQSGRVNDTEITWLARSLRVDEEVVREWWDDEDMKRRGEKMMMVWCAARELERARWYQDRGMS